MTKAPYSGQPDTTPEDYPETVPPRDLYPTSDIRFVLIELGKISSGVNALKLEVKTQSDKIGSLDKTVDRARTAVIVAAAILSVVGGVFWWALGDRITVAVQKGLLSDPMGSPSPDSTRKPRPRPPNSN